jgi:hypothetical protein
VHGKRCAHAGGQRIDIAGIIGIIANKGDTGMARFLARILASSSHTAATVEQEYCGYSGSTTIWSTPWASSSSTALSSAGEP